MENLTIGTDSRKADAARRPVAVEALAALGVPNAAAWVDHAVESGTVEPTERERAVLRSMAEVAPEVVEWLWEGRIPLGGVTARLGDPGEGKSTVSLAIATAVSLGVPLPGETERREPADVLLLSAEDSPAHTIRPRLDAMGADVARVHVLDGILRTDGQTVPVQLAEPSHRAHLREAMETHRPRLVIIDPITAYLAETDTHRDADVRTVLAPLAEIAAEYDAAIVYIMHLRKSQADRAIYRAGGSIAFIGAARSALLVGRDPDDEHRRGVAHVKSNLSPLASTVGFDIEDGRFGWLEESDLTAERMLSAASGEEERSALEEAVEWLRDFLAGGAWELATAIKAAARKADIADRTLRRAGARLNVEKARRGEGRSRPWYWRLPLGDHGGGPPNQGGAHGHLIESIALQGDTGNGRAIGAQVSVLDTYTPETPSDDELIVTEDVA